MDLRSTSHLQGQAIQLLRRALNNPTATFRDGQWEAIEQLVLNRSRLLVVERTGWGKSLVYFMATRLLRDSGAGPSLLISPLKALMRNQIEAAERLGVRAERIDSSNPDEWAGIQARVLAGEVDILLVSPERLANDRFREDLLLPMAANLGMFVVDEAHCISDWGHDFRPDYRRIVRVLQAMPPGLPVLATTATANDRVVDDIKMQLGEGLRIVRGPLVRASLQLQTISLPSQAARMAWLAEHLPELPHSGIIYALTQRDSERLSAWLRARGMAIEPYHAGLSDERRTALEDDLLANRLKALVATTALGMGFDKPDLGFVIHYQRPGSVVHYYQQVGRAGRALDAAYGILLSGEEDQEILNYFVTNALPPLAHEQDVLAALEVAEDGLRMGDLQAAVNLSKGQLEKVLKLLALESPSPITKIDSRYYRTPIDYVADRAKAEELVAIRYEEQDIMQCYMTTQICLMQFLAEELSDPTATPCGKCANCQGGPLIAPTFSNELACEAATFLRRSENVLEPRKLWPSAEAFRDYPFGRGTIPLPMRPQEGRSLSIWGDAGWGELVRQGKQREGRFDDALVEGLTAMIRDRWRPSPAPTWVTCVPSLAHPDLVPDFAARVAKRLGLPFVPCLRKTRDTPPQKTMENSHYQAANLDGAFEVDSWEGLIGPVLLVDDMVDSRWTFTVLAALLRRAGSGPVFPVALASTTKGS